LVVLIFYFDNSKHFQWLSVAAQTILFLYGFVGAAIGFKKYVCIGERLPASGPYFNLVLDSRGGSTFRVLWHAARIWLGFLLFVGAAAAFLLLAFGVVCNSGRRSIVNPKEPIFIRRTGLYTLSTPDSGQGISYIEMIRSDNGKVTSATPVERGSDERISGETYRAVGDLELVSGTYYFVAGNAHFADVLFTRAINVHGILHCCGVFLIGVLLLLTGMRCLKGSSQTANHTYGKRGREMGRETRSTLEG